MSVTIYDTAGDHTFTWPDGNCTALVRVIGGGGGGGPIGIDSDADLGAGGGGGGGSAWAVVTKGPTSTTLDIVVGAGGAAETFGGESTVSQDAVELFSATGGASPIGRNGGLPGTGGGGFVNTTGGNGGDNDQGIFVVPVAGGGGGGQGAGRVRNGNPGLMNGEIGGAPGFGPVGNGGAGGFGGAGPTPGPATVGQDGQGPGGGGGGGGAGMTSGAGHDGWAEVICPAPPKVRKCCCPKRAISCDDLSFFDCFSAKCFHMETGTWEVNPDSLDPYADDSVCPDCADDIGTAFDIPILTSASTCCIAAGALDLPCGDLFGQGLKATMTVEVELCSDGTGFIAAGMDKEGYASGALGGGGGSAQFLVTSLAGDIGSDYYVTPDDFQEMLRSLCAGGSVDVPWVVKDQLDHCKYSGDSVTISLIGGCTGGVSPLEGDCASTPNSGSDGTCDEYDGCTEFDGMALWLHGFADPAPYNDGTYDVVWTISNLSTVKKPAYFLPAASLFAGGIVQCVTSTKGNFYKPLCDYSSGDFDTRYATPGILIRTDTITADTKIEYYAAGIADSAGCDAGLIGLTALDLFVQRFYFTWDSGTSTWVQGVFGVTDACDGTSTIISTDGIPQGLGGGCSMTASSTTTLTYAMYDQTFDVSAEFLIT